jgi:hypothetical protein
MPHSSPAAQVERTLVEDSAVAGWQEVGGEDDKGVGPHQESVLYTPPLVIVQVALNNK